MNAPETLLPAGFRRIDGFDAARNAWPRGRQPGLILEAAETFRKTFKAGGTITGVRTIDLVAAGYPAGYAFNHAAFALNPYLAICNRLLLIRYQDCGGKSRLLAWEPTILENSAKAPFFAELIKFYGEFLSNTVFKTEYHTLAQALAKAGVRAEDVDYVAFDHLHVQDVRGLIGTADGSIQPAFPNAKLIAQPKELDTVFEPHPMQTAWYVPDSGVGAERSRLLPIEGDVLLGTGIVLIATPGHTDGNVSLVLNTDDGIWVSSENGVAVDNWHPEHSKIPGLRGYRQHYQRDVILNANTLEDPQDQYNSMLLERALADVSKKDARFKQVLPSTELLPWKRNWPCTPALFQGGIHYGTI